MEPFPINGRTRDQRLVEVEGTFMSFASNWLEELALEWLELEGFLAIGRLRILGKRQEPDAVGARFDAESSGLQIRHCETAEWLNESKQADKYQQKFSVQRAVEERFTNIFGITNISVYEKVVITRKVSPALSSAIYSKVPGVELLTSEMFIRDRVLPSIVRWRNRPRRPLLPQDKWLLLLLEDLRTNEMLTR
jgi:hypothetical protein